MKSFRNLIVLLIILSVLMPHSLSALTLADEKKYGKEINLEIARSEKIYRDPFLSLYLHDMKQRLEATAGLPFPITLTILESREMNAFATYGGYVYTTTGLIVSAGKEDEVAGVMGHEFAHIGKRHIAKRVEKEKYITATMLGAALLAALVGGDTTKSAILTTAAAGGQALSLKYSREDEDEADRAGSTIADKAGYNPAGVADFMRRLRLTGIEKTVPQYLLTHPYPEERIIKIEAMWGHKRTSKPDTSFFPFIQARTSVLQQPTSMSVLDKWMGLYRKDPKNPIHAYAAALIEKRKGNLKESIAIARTISSPHKNMLIGEILCAAQQFRDAIEILQNEPSPAGRFFLAKAYEGLGSTDMALSILADLSMYGKAYPEIYYRTGMLSGRTGNQARGFEYLGRYYFETGQYDLAKNNLDKAIARYGINSGKAKELMAILDEMKIK